MRLIGLAYRMPSLFVSLFYPVSQQLLKHECYRVFIV